MDIDKDKLSAKYLQGDMDYFFKESERVTSFLIYTYFKIRDREQALDMKQECLENLWKKIQQGKVDPSKNLFAFVWKNSTFRILEILRKEKKRKEKVQFCEYDEVKNSYENLSDHARFGNKYISVIVKELSTVQ